MNGVPAVCCAIAPPPTALTAKWVVTPPTTVNAALVPVAEGLELVAVSVKLPVLVSVTDSAASTPFVNAGVVIGAPVSVPVDVMTVVPANDVAVFPIGVERGELDVEPGVPATPVGTGNWPRLRSPMTAKCVTALRR